jgi:hypothetical protein
MDIDIKTLLTIISTSIGLISALMSKLYFDRIHKIHDNKDKLRLQTDISNIEKKLKTFYIPIYFKLFIISITKKQIKYLKNKNIEEYYKIEKNIIIKIHEEIIEIISSCYTLDTINDIPIEIIKNYINYVIIYKNIRNMNLTIKLEDIGIKYPKNFLIEIENKITELHEKYEVFLGRKEKKKNNKCLSFFRYYDISKNNIRKENKNMTNKWSISDYIKNNINISDINKILYDDKSSLESLYNNINLDKIFDKINRENEIKLDINMTNSIPFEYNNIDQ